MSSACTSVPVIRTELSLPVLRWAALIALLLAEVVALTLRYDTGTLDGNGSWWAELMGQTHMLPKLVVATATALLVLGGARLLSELRILAEHFVQPHAALAYLTAHLVSLAALVKLSGLLLDGNASALPCPGAWVVGWFVLASATFGFWAAVAVPPSSWLALLRRYWGLLVVGSAFGLGAWSLAQVTGFIWQPLGTSTLWGVRALLTLAGGNVVCEPSSFTIGTSSFTVQIAEGCSGYEGIGMIWAVVGLFLWVSRKELRFPHALLLLPLGTAVIWLANVLRITALIALGTWGWGSIALSGFHSQAGWLAFNAVGLGLLAFARQCRFFGGTSATSAPTASIDRTSAYVAPLLAVVAAAMMTGAFSSGFDQLYALRVLAGGAVLWYFRREYVGLVRGSSGFAVIMGVVVFILWIALEPASSFAAGQGSRPAGLIGASTAWSVSWLAFRMMGAVLVIPVVEELAFRGFLIRRLIAADFERIALGRFSWFAFLASSVVFGLVHGDRWVAAVLAGAIFALALYRRGRLSDAIVAHATTNALLAAFAIGTGSWALWA